MNKIIEDLNWRYSTKKFDTEKQISTDDLNTIMEAFRLTASSYGLEPWKLFLVKNKEIKQSLLEHSWNQNQVVEAPYLLVFARNNAKFDDMVDQYFQNISEIRNVDIESLDGFRWMVNSMSSSYSEPELRNWMDKQVYIALWNILNVLAGLRIDSCAMEGVMPEKYDEVLGLKEKWYATVLALPIGYRAEDDKYVEVKKVRFPIDKVTEII